MKSEKSVITIGSILAASLALGFANNSQMASLEALALAIIAAYLAGIYVELKNFNKKPKDEQKQ